MVAIATALISVVAYRSLAGIAGVCLVEFAYNPCVLNNILLYIAETPNQSNWNRI